MTEKNTQEMASVSFLKNTQDKIPASPKSIVNVIQTQIEKKKKKIILF